MQPWIIYAILSMIFAGITSILAKYGLEKVDPDLGLGIRTTTIFFLIAIFNLATDKIKYIHHLTTKHWILLAASGLATSLSWIFYYRAMKDGLVSYVAAIDKGSIVITLVLSFILLKEPFTPKIAIGGGLIVIGMFVLLWK